MISNSVLSCAMLFQLARADSLGNSVTPHPRPLLRATYGFSRILTPVMENQTENAMDNQMGSKMMKGL